MTCDGFFDGAGSLFKYCAIVLTSSGFLFFLAWIYLYCVSDDIFMLILI